MEFLFKLISTQNRIQRWLEQSISIPDIDNIDFEVMPNQWVVLTRDDGVAIGRMLVPQFSNAHGQNKPVMPLMRLTRLSQRYCIGNHQQLGTVRSSIKTNNRIKVGTNTEGLSQCLR